MLSNHADGLIEARLSATATSAMVLKVIEAITGVSTADDDSLDDCVSVETAEGQGTTAAQHAPPQHLLCFRLNFTMVECQHGDLR